MLLPAVAEARLAKVIDYRFAAHAVIVEVRYVVILALKRFAGGIFSFAGDLADALGRIQDSANVFLRWAGSSIVSAPDGWGKVVEDC